MVGSAAAFAEASLGAGGSTLAASLSVSFSVSLTASLTVSLTVSLGASSIRSSASTGWVAGASWLCANLVSGAGRQAGALANSSWAVRSNAAAPNPNTRIDIDSTRAPNRKRNPGSMNAKFRFAGSEGLKKTAGNAVMTEVAVSAALPAASGAQRIRADFEDSARIPRASAKNRPDRTSNAMTRAVSRASAARLQRSPECITNAGTGANRAELS